MRGLFVNSWGDPLVISILFLLHGRGCRRRGGRPAQGRPPCLLGRSSPGCRPAQGRQPRPRTACPPAWPELTGAWEGDRRRGGRRARLAGARRGHRLAQGRPPRPTLPARPLGRSSPAGAREGLAPEHGRAAARE
jgi:hypothetical protein